MVAELVCNELVSVSNSLISRELTGRSQLRRAAALQGAVALPHVEAQPPYFDP
jgi:hypothetical protein